MKYFRLSSRTYSNREDWSLLKSKEWNRLENNKWTRIGDSMNRRDFTHLLFQSNRPTKGNNWRYRMREREKQKYSLNELLMLVSKEDRQTVIKDLCHQEIQPFIQKMKLKRNLRRNELTRWAIRLKFPKDMTKYILSFTIFKEKM